MTGNWRQHLVLAAIAFGGVAAYVHYSSATKGGATRDSVYVSSTNLENGAGHVEALGEPLRYESNRQDYQVAGSFIRRQKFNEAESVLRGILARTPDEIAATYQLGTVLFLKREYSASEQIYRGLVEQHPEFFRARAGTGAIARVQGRYQNAIQEYSLLLQSNPTEALGYYGRGMSYASLGQIPAAKADLEKAVSLLPKSADLADRARGCLARIEAREQQGEGRIDDEEQFRTC